MNAALQRYSLTVEPDDSAYMELDPDGYYVIGDEAETAIAEARAAALDEARAAVANLSGWDKRSVPGGVHVHRGLALAAIDALREGADKV